MFIDPLMAIDWNIKENMPRWRLSPADRMTVDITKDFNSRHQLIAHRDLCDWEAEKIRQAVLCEKITVSRKITAKQLTFKSPPSLSGYDDSVFDFIEFPSWMWQVTNSFSIARQHKAVKNNEHLHTQFIKVPYYIFKRYWRRPVRLNSKWHHGKGTTYPKQCYEVLRFDKMALSKHVIYADFSYKSMYVNTTFMDSQIIPWMRLYTPVLKILTDEDSPFVKEEHEFLFLTEWL